MSVRVGPALAAVLAIAVGSAIALGAATARADPNAADIEEARQLYHDGKELRAKGDLAGALAKLRAAYALAPTPITGLELARTYAVGGSLVDARETLLAVERMPVRPDESAKAAESRAEGHKLVDELTARVATLTVQLRAAKGAPPPSVTIDGHALPAEALGAPRKIDPGTHALVAESADGARASKSVTLAEGETRTIDLSLEANGAAAAADVNANVNVNVNVDANTNAAAARGAAGKEPPPRDVATVSAASSGAGHGGPGTPSLFFLGTGVAVAGLLVGAVTGIVAFSDASTVKQGCPGGRCPPELHDELDASQRMGTVSNVAFVAAGVGAALAAFGWFWPGSSSSSPSQPNATGRVSLRAGARFVGVGGSWR